MPNLSFDVLPNVDIFGRKSKHTYLAAARIKYIFTFSTDSMKMYRRISGNKCQHGYIYHMAKYFSIVSKHGKIKRRLIPRDVSDRQADKQTEVNAR